MHCAGPARLVSAGTRSGLGTADDEQSTGDQAHASSTHGRPRHALGWIRNCRQNHRRHSQRSDRTPATGSQVTEGNFVQSKAERTSSLAIIAAAVESGGICGSCPALWPGRGGGRCICRRERRIAGGARFAWGRAQPGRPRTGAAFLGRSLKFIRRTGQDGEVVLPLCHRSEDQGYAGGCVLAVVAGGGGVGAAIPLPQGIPPPVTEVVLPRLTALL